jgi:hypothetical protein
MFDIDRTNGPQAAHYHFAGRSDASPLSGWARHVPHPGRAGRLHASLVASANLHQKRDPAAHIPSLDFTLQRMLGFELGAAIVDRRSEPVERLFSIEVLANGKLE